MNAIKAAVLGLLFAVSAGAAWASGDHKTGEFAGASDHVTTGTVEITKDERGYIVHLSEDFSLDGAPDPQIAFGKGGVYQEGSSIGVLMNLNGEQSYRIPPTFSLDGITEVFIWCTQFNVPLGVAKLGGE